MKTHTPKWIVGCLQNQSECFNISLRDRFIPKWIFFDDTTTLNRKQRTRTVTVGLQRKWSILFVSVEVSSKIRRFQKIRESGIFFLRADTPTETVTYTCSDIKSLINVTYVRLRVKRQRRNKRRNRFAWSRTVVYYQRVWKCREHGQHMIYAYLPAEN